MKNMGSPVKTSVEFTRTRTPAPWLGQHSDEVLKSLGYKADSIAELHAQGVVYDKYRAKTPA